MCFLSLVFLNHFLLLFPAGCLSDSLHSFHVNVDWYIVSKFAKIEQIEWLFNCVYHDVRSLLICFWMMEMFFGGFVFCSGWWCNRMGSIVVVKNSRKENHPLNAFPCKDWTKTGKKREIRVKWANHGTVLPPMLPLP